MPANYPNADPALPTLVDAVDYPQADDLNDVYREVEAIGTALRGTLAHALTTSGNLTVGGTVTVTGGQIAFPATQAASSNANTLDDYEESTWIPTLGGSATYTVHEGTYTKVGRMVTARGHITVNAIGTGATGTIAGFPFAAAITTAGSIGYFSGAGLSVVWVGIYIEGGASTANITALASAGAASSIAPAFFTNSTDLHFCITYQV